MDSDKYGPWALIVGGSEGVGAAFARQLAVLGFSLNPPRGDSARQQILQKELAGKG